MNAEGKPQNVFMGSYGIGPGRVMGTIVELLSDEKGIVWPESVAPFMYHLVSAGNDEAVVEYADALYADLTKAGKETLYDDRDARAGEKFADSDLMGMPWRVVVGKNTVASGELELVNRATGEVEKLTREQLLAR
jgi:prolyl-tRNA synthetase